MMIKRGYFNGLGMGASIVLQVLLKLPVKGISTKLIIQTFPLSELSSQSRTLISYPCRDVATHTCLNYRFYSVCLIILSGNFSYCTIKNSMLI